MSRIIVIDDNEPVVKFLAETLEQSGHRVQLLNTMEQDEEDRRFQPETLRDLERRHIMKTLEYFSHDNKKTAEALGISTRTLRNKLKMWSANGKNPAHDL